MEESLFCYCLPVSYDDIWFNKFIVERRSGAAADWCQRVSRSGVAAQTSRQVSNKSSSARLRKVFIKKWRQRSAGASHVCSTAARDVSKTHRTTLSPEHKPQVIYWIFPTSFLSLKEQFTDYLQHADGRSAPRLTGAYNSRHVISVTSSITAWSIFTSTGSLNTNAAPYWRCIKNILSNGLLITPTYLNHVQCWH